MQLFILGRTLAEQHRFARVVQEGMGLSADALPVYSAIPLTRTGPTARTDVDVEFAGLPLSAYTDGPEVSAVTDVAAAFRQWQDWVATDHCMIIGADAPDVFIRLFGAGEGCALVRLEHPEDFEPSGAREIAARATIEAYLDWHETQTQIPAYIVSAEEYDMLTACEMYEGPSEAFFELWAA